MEQVSCDESYVEINIKTTDTGNDIYAFVNSVAEKIRTDIVRNTACTASIGIGPNKVCCDIIVCKRILLLLLMAVPLLLESY